MATTVAIGLCCVAAGFVFWLGTRSVVTTSRGRSSAVGVGAGFFLVAALLRPYGFGGFGLLFAACVSAGWVTGFFLSQLSNDR